MCDAQTVDPNTLKPRGLSPVNWSNRGQIRRAQCPPGTGGGKADLRCPTQGSGQVIVVPWQCDNLQLYKQKFASECSQPHWKVYSPSDFPRGLSGGWCSSREFPLCLWELCGVWGTLTWGGRWQQGLRGLHGAQQPKTGNAESWWLGLREAPFFHLQKGLISLQHYRSHSPQPLLLDNF